MAIKKVIIELTPIEQVLVSKTNSSKIYGVRSPTSRRPYILKKQQNGLYAFIQICQANTSWGWGSIGFPTVRGAIQDIIGFSTHDVFEFDTTEEFLQWGLNNLRGGS